MLLAHANALVGENKALTAANAKLRSLVGRISQLIGDLPGLELSGITPNGRRSRQAVRTPKRKRRKITNPEVLERRRAALAKAREVLAARRAMQQPKKRKAG